MDREIIRAYAERYQVCPFELGLDASLFADAIIGDYNYVFDPRVNLKRFFSQTAYDTGRYVFLVDEDVDCFDMNDVLWAMNTRFQGDVDVITIPGVRCHPLDPSNDPAFSPSIRDHGIACKTIFDCTVPYDLKEDFHRARFMELDPEKWLKK